MKRVEKIALLNKILTGQADETTRQQLQRSSGPGMVAILFQPGGNTSPSPDDMVSFYHKGQQVTMPYKDIQTFTRYNPLAVVWLPDDGRRSAIHIDGNARSSLPNL